MQTLSLHQAKQGLDWIEERLPQLEQQLESLREEWEQAFPDSRYYLSRRGGRGGADRIYWRSRGKGGGDATLAQVLKSTPQDRRSEVGRLENKRLNLNYEHSLLKASHSKLEQYLSKQRERQSLMKQLTQ